MARAVQLEDFFASQPSTTSSSDDTNLNTDAHLAAYEDGYKAGWDDAVSAEVESRERIGADLRQNLEDISFSFNEARQHVLQNVSPLLSLMSEKLLPDAMQMSFAHTVIARLTAEIESASNQPIELKINPAHRCAVEELLEPLPALPVVLVDDASLGPGQAVMRGSDKSSSIDIDAVQAQLRNAMTAFLDNNSTEVSRAG